MKKSLLFSLALGITAMATGQCNQLFISEYVVGSGNNKAYELYNPTASPIDLNGYVMQRWSNGEQASTDETILAGTIPAYGTWVVANGQTEDIQLEGFISPACNPELQALADQLDAPYPAPTFMNGNDALILVKNNTIICDIFGKPGENPGTAWAAPDGTFITNSQTMVRKPTVTGGVVVIPVSFVPLAQYDTLGINNWSNLGMHTCSCNPTVGTQNNKALDVKIYPNPIANNEPLTIEANAAISKIEIYDITGKLIKSSYTLINSTTGRLDVSKINQGAFLINVYLENNVTFSTRLIKQ